MVAVEDPPAAAGAGVWTEIYLKLPELVALAWRRRIAAALAAPGGIRALHAARAAVLEEYEKFAASAVAAAKTDGALAPAAELLRAFVADLRARWTTELELEDIICRAITPPAEELRKKLAKLPGPPQWWWEMDHKKPW